MVLFPSKCDNIPPADRYRSGINAWAVWAVRARLEDRSSTVLDVFKRDDSTEVGVLPLELGRVAVISRAEPRDPTGIRQEMSRGWAGTG